MVGRAFCVQYQGVAYEKAEGSFLFSLKSNGRLPGKMKFEKPILENNISSGDGGAINVNDNNTLIISDSIFEGNRGAAGGAITGTGTHKTYLLCRFSAYYHTRLL